MKKHSSWQGKIPEFKAPDTTTFIDPFDDLQWLDYYEDLFKWHGFVRFLGLPHRQDTPDVPIQEIYVQPEVSRRHLSPDQRTTAGKDETVPVLGVLEEEPRIVLLGDPGSGKSTLVSWITWVLSRSESSWLRTSLGNLVPLPFVVRDLEIGADIDWDKFWAAFLRLPVARALGTVRDVEGLLKRGQAFFLLDGLDEISRVEVRRVLRGAVFEGMERFPQCRWLMTSRVVGYEIVPFHLDPFEFLNPDDGSVTQVDTEKATLTYVAPFSDAQIEIFAKGWYATREHAEERASGGANDLVTAIRKNPHTLRLARIPNLLTFMALLHRVLAHLPNGRALLYQEIAKAYLETIDTFRGLQEFDWPLHQKMRWLGHVAFQMQRQRESAGKGEEGREVLVEGKKVEHWLSEEMRKDLGSAAASTASTFLDYLARRSGLLLPRGPDVFAFAHLSFQEFFAAVYLMGQITSPAWLRDKAIEGASREDVHRYGGLVSWQETLVLLFELLGSQPGWASEVYDCLFGEDLDPKDTERTALLAEIVADPHSALNEEERFEATRTSWRVELTRQQGLEIEYRDSCRVPRTLLQSATTWRGVLSALKGVASLVDVHQVRLAGIPYNSLQLSAFLEELGVVDSEILHFYLEYTHVEDLSIVARFTQLRTLYLHDTRVKDLSPLSKLSKLRTLSLGGTRVKDLGPLESLSQLRVLILNNTLVTDLSPLANLSRLIILHLGNTPVEDLSPLENLSQLRTLLLGNTLVKDLSSLANLFQLSTLFLSNTFVEDLSPLANLSQLSTLDLDETHVKDLTPVQGIKGIKIFGPPASANASKRPAHRR